MASRDVRTGGEQMTVYTYDLAELEETAGSLNALAEDFAEASAVRREAQQAAGYPSLREALQEFTDNWSHNRDKQLEAIRGAASALGDICDNYQAFDCDAAAQLQAD